MGDLEEGYQRIPATGSAPHNASRGKWFKVVLASIGAFSLVLPFVKVMMGPAAAAAMDPRQAAHAVSSARARTGLAQPTSLIFGWGGKKEAEKKEEAEDVDDITASLAKMKASGDEELSKMSSPAIPETAKAGTDLEATGGPGEVRRMNMDELIDAIEALSNATTENEDGTPLSQEQVMKNIDPKAADKLKELISNPAMLQEMMRDLTKLNTDPEYTAKVNRVMEKVMKMWTDPKNVNRMQHLIQNPELLKKVSDAMGVNMEPGMMKQMMENMKEVSQDPEKMKKFVQSAAAAAEAGQVSGPDAEQEEEFDPLKLAKGPLPKIDSDHLNKVNDMMKDPAKMEDMMKKGVEGARHMMTNPNMMAKVMGQMNQAMQNPEIVSQMAKMMQDPAVMENVKSMMSTNLAPGSPELAHVQAAMQNPAIVANMKQMMSSLGAGAEAAGMGASGADGLGALGLGDIPGPFGAGGPSSSGTQSDGLS